MSRSENPRAPRQPDDSTKLIIRDEVEQPFGNPPKSFVDLIETEVEKRVDLRVKHYTWMIFIVGGLFTTFSALLGWRVESNLDAYIDKQLSEKALMQLSNKQQITLLK